MSRTRPLPVLALLALVLGLGASACGGASGSAGADTTRPSGASGTIARPAPLDACAAMDAEAIARVTGTHVEAGKLVAAPDGGSRCEFAAIGGGVSVAVQLGGADPSTGAPSPLLTVEGFERAYGPSVEVPRLAGDGYGALRVERSLGKAAVISTDGAGYALVVLAGFGLTAGDLDVTADLVRELEAGR